MALNYLFLGCIIDLAAGFTSKFKSSTWIVAIACGACWIFIPLFRLAMSLIVAMPQGAFRSGILYPLFTHLVFGIAGGLVAAGILSLTIKKS
jgi:hypothetical protein